MDPAKRASVAQVLVSPLFDRYKKPPYHYPLTSVEYNQMLECYMANTCGVKHLHWPKELDRLRSIHRESVATGKNLSEETLLETASTEYTETFLSGTVRGAMCLMKKDGLRESISDALFDPGNEACTLYEFPGLGAGECPAGPLTAHQRDSMTIELELSMADTPEMQQRPLELEIDYKLGWAGLGFKIPWMGEEKKEVGQGPLSTELDPRVISIKRKQSDGKCQSPLPEKAPRVKN